MKDEKLYLLHIRESLERIRNYTKPGREAFYAGTQIQDAVLRNFEVIGEAAKRVSPQMRSQAPDIPWQKIAGFRDVLIHRYDELDLDEIWETIESNVDPLYSQICALLENLG